MDTTEDPTEPLPLDRASLTLMADHVTWMRRRRLADQTIYTREGHILRFMRWAQTQPALENAGPDVVGRTLLDCDRDLIDAYQSTLTLSVAVLSERATISNLRQLYAWAVREERLDRDPTVRAILPRGKRRRPRPIREERLSLAWREGDLVMRAILALAAMAGLRACEIARLSWTDVDFEGEMHVIGKGGHERAIWIADCQPLIDTLKAIKKARRGPVIPRADGKPGHNAANSLDKRANTFLHRLDIDETLHQLRHRFGTIGYRACTDPIAIMRLMGHADLSATVIYADASSDSAQAAIAATGQIAGNVAQLHPNPEADPDDEADPEQGDAGPDRLAS